MQASFGAEAEKPGRVVGRTPGRRAARLGRRRRTGVGDVVSATVTVTGHRVVLRIRNVTRRASFSKKVTMAAPDASSAEWIAEAPSACGGYGRCRALPLADFGTIGFTNATATAGGHTGTISDPAWTPTAIQLQAERGFFGRRFAPDVPAAGAVPGALSADGAGFAVTWQQSAAPAPTQPDDPLPA